MHTAHFYAELAAEISAHSIVDLGCGTGLLTCGLARQGHHVLGVDPAPCALRDLHLALRSGGWLAFETRSDGLAYLLTAGEAGMLRIGVRVLTPMMRALHRGRVDD